MEEVIKQAPDNILSEDIEIISGTLNDLTPQEILYNSFQGIKKSIYLEIIDTILSKTPREFEKLVVNLMQKLGYGGQIKNSGLVTYSVFESRSSING